MRKIILAFLISIMAISISCQTRKGKPNFNFSFEQSEKGMPAGWSHFGSSNYLIYLDSAIAKHEKYSAVIEYKEGKPDFKAWGFTLPGNYDGKKITLSGYIKTENVTNGYAGLWMRIDPDIAFDNMASRGIKGTTDWTKYEITLSMNPAKTQQIVVGGMLVGEGKMWLDDLKVTIDGKDIKELNAAKSVKTATVPADKDKKFDNGSNIEFPALNEMMIKDLELLGKIWGFLNIIIPK